MRKNGTRFAALAALLVVCGWLAFSATSTADMEIQKQAKAAGVDAKNCQYCHTVAMPKKENAAKELNDCGKWLVDQKAAKKADKVDGAWAKDCPKK